MVALIFIMKKLFSTMSQILLMCLATFSLAMASCGGDDDPEPNPDPKPGEEEPMPNPDPTPVTDDKKFLEETAKEFLNLFKASDQSAAIAMANDFVNDYGDLDLPAEFTDDNTAAAPALTMMKGIAHSLSGDICSISRSYSTYFYSFDKYAGIYEPDKYEWKRVGDSKDIIFRYTDRSGQTCAIAAVASNGTWDGSITIDGDTYKATVPKHIDITVTKGSTIMLTAKIDTDFAKKSHLQVNTETSVANLYVYETLSGTNTSLETYVKLSVNGTCVLTAKANVAGSSLLDQDYIQTLIENEDEDRILKMFGSGEATTNILGKIQVKGTVKNLIDIRDALDFEGYDRYNSNAQNDAKKAAATLNANVVGKFYYNGTNEERGNVTWQAYISYESSWNGAKEWGVEPILGFSDGTTYSFESYFGNGKFGTTETLFNNLWDSYKALWK